MLTQEKISEKITSRARSQFLRDISCIKQIVVQYGGCMSILDAMNLAKDAQKREQKQQRPQKKIFGVFGGKTIVDETDYQYIFLLKFMAGLELEQLSVDDFAKIDLARVYSDYYKKDYEDYQCYMFQTHDVPMYECARRAVLARKNAQSIENGCEVENC